VKADDKLGCGRRGARRTVTLEQQQEVGQEVAASDSDRRDGVLTEWRQDVVPGFAVSITM
jgi:hypothetical protein